MKKLITYLILAYLSFAINSIGYAQDQKNLQDEKVLKIGALLPLSGKFQDVGQSFLKAIQLALSDISDKNIKIYPKDSKGNPEDAFKAAQELQELDVSIVIGPIFYESLEKIKDLDNITFISFTNKIQNIPKNTIAFGINIDSQISALNNYFNKNKISQTLLLSPKDYFLSQTQVIEESNLKLFDVFFYNVSPKKITSEIEVLTKYKERKKDLERRIKILEKSDLPKDKNELKILEQKHTLGKVSFDSVLVIDFGERLKSVLTSFIFSDVSSNDVNFFTINQWFDESFFNESALQNLHFPSINFANLKKFRKKFRKIYNEDPKEISILAYDALGLIYYCWYNNNSKFEKSQLYNKKGFKGLHGEFFIENNQSKQKLNIYKVSKKKFIKVY